MAEKERKEMSIDPGRRADTGDPTETGGTVPGGGLGGNRLSEGSHAGEVDEQDLTPGERRRGGQSVEPQERHPQD